MSVFLQKRFLDGLFLPSSIIGRRQQVEELLQYLESLRQGFAVPLISVYGRSGSGKSTLVKFVCKNIEDLACFAFANLRKAKTVFGCANLILSELDVASLKSADGINKAIDCIGNTISEKLKSKRKKFMVLVLDEYDVIFSDKRGNPSEFMYKLLTLAEELREKDLWLCIITISNNTLSEYDLDDRIKSRMGNSEVFFPPYSQGDILQILKDRSQKAFAKKIGDDVLQYCSELSCAEHGDARRALDLLRISGELCDGQKITKENIDAAYAKLQKDRLENIVTNSSSHQRILIGAICSNMLDSDSGWSATSSIYETHRGLLQKTKPLSYRRVTDLLVELKNSGLLISKTQSRGRGGYGTEYRLCFSPYRVGQLVDKEWWNDRVRKIQRIDDAEKLLGTFKPRARKRDNNFALFFKN